MSYHDESDEKARRLQYELDDAESEITRLETQVRRVKYDLREANDRLDKAHREAEYVMQQRRSETYSAQCNFEDTIASLEAQLATIRTWSARWKALAYKNSHGGKVVEL